MRRRTFQRSISFRAMPNQQAVETILLRQLASYLTVPIWIMDAGGNLLYYNEPAEKLLGVRFDDAGPINAEQLADLFRVTDMEGEAMPDEGMPVVRALTTRTPAHGSLRFLSLDQIWHDIEVSALPLEGQGGRFLGVFASFWETPA
jgi:PAS domain-containing protein